MQVRRSRQEARATNLPSVYKEYTLLSVAMVAPAAMHLSVPCPTLCAVKLVVQVRLYPDKMQAVALKETLLACNAAANDVAQTLHEQRSRSVFDLQKLVYADVKARFGLSAQPTVRTIKKVFDAHLTRMSLIRNGRAGKAGSPRRTRCEAKPIRFNPLAGQPFDDRCLSWQFPEVDRGTDGTVSIWTTRGRLRAIVFKCSAQQMQRLRDHRAGQSHLFTRDGKWYLSAVCEVPAAAPNESPAEFLGVDLGIVNIAYTSTGQAWSGGAVTFRRKKNQHLRSKLQSKGTKGARRLLKKRSRKERRFAADTNHKIAHRIVAEAQRTGRGIAVEDLSGIRDRARLRRPQRATLHKWSFHQLGHFLEYKAGMSGVPFEKVDPRYTSQTCYECGHREKANRLGEVFACRRCGTVSHADHNAARNIARLGQIAWEAGQQSTVHSSR